MKQANEKEEKFSMKIEKLKKCRDFFHKNTAHYQYYQNTINALLKYKQIIINQN